MIKHSDTITAFSLAFVAAQSEMAGAKKTSKNPHFRSTYADLASVLEAVIPPLNKHGIAVLQFPSFDKDTALVSVETRLLHKSGEWMGGTCSAAPKDARNVQAIGSTITYLKRYGLQSLTGCPSEDDDGNSASAAPPRVARRDPAPGVRQIHTPPPPPAGPMTTDQMKAAAVAAGVTLGQCTYFLVDRGRPSPQDLTPNQQRDFFDHWLRPNVNQIKNHVRADTGARDD